MVLANRQGNVVKKFPTSQDKHDDASFWNAAKPNFFAGFQILRNGNIIVSNWQGHGTGHGTSGFQLIEIDSALTKAVAYWKQDASMVSSLHGVLVLDSLDTRLLYSDYNGILEPLSDPVATRHPLPAELPAHQPSALTAVCFFDLLGRQSTQQPRNCCFVAL